ncbi:hypothetical protein [Pantoea stewartii]|nr:hypothetical protein [Pantoea stewartii]
MGALAQHQKRWSWNDRSGNGRMTVRRCNKPDVMGLSGGDLRWLVPSSRF